MKKTILKLLHFCVLACIALSLYMRGLLFDIAYEYDELFTAITTDPALSFSWIYSHYLMADVHPPLYNALVWGWNHLVPYGPEMWLRLPSLFMGIGALAWAWFYFPKRFGKTARLLFTGLLSCNLYAVAYSQHARSYMLVLLLAVPLTFLFVNMSYKICQKQTVGGRMWLGFGVLALLLSWSHYFGALLFGAFTVVLLGQAVYYKYKLKWFIAVPGAVFILFLPWLVPNFLNQLEFHRFGGNWWANQTPYWHALLALVFFWASSFKGAVIMSALIALSVIDGYIRDGRAFFFSKRRGLLALGAALLVFLLCVSVVSVKTYMFINRYFIVVLPLVYLIFSLLIAPLFRKSIIGGILFILFLSFGLENFWTQHNGLLKNGDMKMPSRMVSQMYRDVFAGKEMFVVAVESFPPATMPALYGFYVNKVYGLDIPVSELFFLDEQARNVLLARQPDAVIWMPNCTGDKLAQVSLAWKRAIYVKEKIGTVCFLQVANGDETDPAS